MKLLGYLSLLMGVFLILMSFVVLSTGESGIYSLLSRQGKINPTHLTGVYDFSSSQAIYDNKVLPVPRYIAQTFPDTQILGETNVAKRIEVDLSNQRLYAFEGENKIFDFAVSTGKWNKTPQGVFRIWIKLKYTLMKGGSEALGTNYYLPNVPYTMFFYNEKVPKTEGYGIHGAYWHNNFGRPMSHGCINMREDDVKQIYYWANPELKGQQGIKASSDNPGTEVIIYGETPTS